MAQQEELPENPTYLFSLDFQRQVLKMLASNLKFASDFGELIKTEYLENQSLRILLNIITSYIMQYEREITLSEATVLIDQEKEKFGFTTEQSKDLDNEARLVFQSTPSETFISEYTLKFIKRQKLKGALYQCVDIIEKNEPYERALHLIDNALAVGAGKDDGVSFADFATLPTAYRDQYNSDELITTGIPSLDACMEGGMAPGELHIIMAPPKCGKTSIGVNCGVANLMRNKAVFHVTCEVKKLDLMMKYAGNVSGLTKREICDTDTEGYETIMSRFAKIKPKIWINYWTELTATTMTFRAWISRIRAQTGVSPDLIIIDYDDLVMPLKDNYSPDDLYGNSGQVYTDMIQLADYFKCPILSFSQGKRECWEWPTEGKLITADMLANSSKKAHKCYSVSSLNFAGGSDQGILYADIVRRGDSKVKIKIKKELSLSRFYEVGG